MTEVSENYKKYCMGFGFDIPSDVPYLNAQAYRGMYNGPVIYIPKSIKYIGSRAFQTSNEGKEIVHGFNLDKNLSHKGIEFEKDSNLQYIESSIVDNYVHFEHVVFPDKLKYVGSEFGRTESQQYIKTIFFPSTIEEIGYYFCLNEKNLEAICIDKPTNSITLPTSLDNLSHTMIWNDQPAMFIKAKHNAKVWFYINGQMIQKRWYVGNVGDVIDYVIITPGYKEVKGTITLTDKLIKVEAQYDLEPLSDFVRYVEDGDIGDLEFDDLSNICSYAFYQKHSLKSVDLSKCTSLTFIPEYCFYESGITNILLPTSIENIDSYAFGLTFSLPTIDFSTCESLTTIGNYAFYNANIYSLDFSKCESLTTIGNSAFYYCGCLMELKLPDNVQSIGNSALSSTLLSFIDIPKNVKQLPSGFMYNSPRITEINIHNEVTTINSDAFGNNVYNINYTLTDVTIPSSVETIGNNVFTRCTNLTTITINKPQDSISGAPWGATNATVVWNG